MGEWMNQQDIKPSDITMVIPAAGVGDRTGENTPKQFVQLGDDDYPQRTPLDLLLDSYENSPEIARLIVVCSPDYRDLTERICSAYSKIEKIVDGGATRHDSLFLGVNAVESLIVGIHDAARPLLYRPALEAAVEKLRQGARAIATVFHPYASMLVCDAGGPVGGVHERWGIAHAISPAFYYTDDLCSALLRCNEQNLEFRDEPAMMMEMTPDLVIHTVEGHRSGFKLTFPEDFDVLAAHRRQLAQNG